MWPFGRKKEQVLYLVPMGEEMNTSIDPDTIETVELYANIDTALLCTIQDGVIFEVVVRRKFIAQVTPKEVK